jgi:hypothetical protein
MNAHNQLERQLRASVAHKCLSSAGDLGSSARSGTVGAIRCCRDRRGADYRCGRAGRVTARSLAVLAHRRAGDPPATVPGWARDRRTPVQSLATSTTP